MATIKHLTSKNSNYAAAESYLTFQHNEYTGLPILDEKGRPKLRDSYLLDTLECGESSFAMACLIANRKYGKNGGREDVKTHHYIISFDPKDAVENGLTMERAQALGLQFCKENFPGHPAIVCTHPDGHNSAGNIHVHIVIGSLRVRTVERQPFMDKPCDWEAGKKHRCTSAMLRHLRVAVMEMCEQADLNQINLLEAQGDHVSEREYWAQRRGQRRLDHANAKLAAEGQQPAQTVYQTELDKLRKQIYAVLNKTTTFEEFSALLMQEHGIAVKESRGRLSYCPPGRTKFITAKKLSKKLEKEQVLTALSQNIQLATAIQPSSEQKPDKIRKLVDIQAKVAAGKGVGYERWAKKFNLKSWSQTLLSLAGEGDCSAKMPCTSALSNCKPSTTMHWRWSKTWMPAWSPSRSCAGILWSIGSTNPLHRSFRRYGIPPSSRSSTVQSLLCTRPLAPISRPTGSGRCRTSKSWMPNTRPFPRRRTGSTPATRKRRSNCVNSAPHNRTWKPSSARKSAATPYRSRRSNEQHSDGSMCE